MTNCNSDIGYMTVEQVYFAITNRSIILCHASYVFSQSPFFVYIRIIINIQCFLTKTIAQARGVRLRKTGEEVGEDGEELREHK